MIGKYLLIVRPYYPDACVDIDITAEVANTPIRSITFLLGDLSNYGVHLLLIDKVIIAMHC